jgi:type II secretory pathway pseudopilin PulG
MGGHMTKKFSLFAIAAAVVMTTIAFQTNAVEKNKRKSQLGAQLEQLLMEHQKFVMAAYKSESTGKINASYTPAALSFEKDFFLYTNFLHDANIQNFLHNVEADINRNGKTGYTMMSYTSISLVNGQSRSIQYAYQSNGKDITLVKQTDNNGNLLKSVYYYDINTQSLKANDYRQNNIIHEKIYKI